MNKTIYEVRNINDIETRCGSGAQEKWENCGCDGGEILMFNMYEDAKNTYNSIRTSVFFDNGRNLYYHDCKCFFKSIYEYDDECNEWYLDHAEMIEADFPNYDTDNVKEYYEGQHG